MASQIQAAQRLYPLLRLISLVQPHLRSVISGYLWEENGRVVGAASLNRFSVSPQFELGNVGVLPEYRGQGIAHRLVNACLDYARRWHGAVVSLNVISENFPAISLYQKLGFVEAGSSDEMTGFPAYSNWTAPPIPSGYQIIQLPFGQWRAPYEVAVRVAAEMHIPLPLPQDFQYPLVLRGVAPLFFRLSGLNTISFAARSDRDGYVGLLELAVQPGGNALKITALEDHARIARPLLQSGIALSERLMPGYPVTLSVPQPWLTSLAKEEGFEQDFRYLRMRLPL